MHNNTTYSIWKYTVKNTRELPCLGSVRSVKIHWRKTENQQNQYVLDNAWPYLYWVWKHPIKDLNASFHCFLTDPERRASWLHTFGILECPLDIVVPSLHWFSFLLQWIFTPHTHTHTASPRKLSIYSAVYFLNMICSGMLELAAFELRCGNFSVTCRSINKKGKESVLSITCPQVNDCIYCIMLWLSECVCKRRFHVLLCIHD